MKVVLGSRFESFEFSIHENFNVFVVFYVFLQLYAYQGKLTYQIRYETDRPNELNSAHDVILAVRS